MSKYTPLGENILIRPAPIEDTTESGLLLLEASKDKPNMGTVVAVGSNTEVKTDDTVYYHAYAGTILELDNDEYVVINKSDLLVKK